MKINIYSHNYGKYAVPQEEIIKIENCLRGLEIDITTNSATNLRKNIIEGLMTLGWSDKVKVDYKSNITITAMKNNIGLCLQTGNMGRFYADILKLETLYKKDKAIAAIYIIPTKDAASILGSNIVYFERLVDELKLYKHTITIPILVIGIN